MNKYVPKEYWEERLKTHFHLKGVGNIIFSEKYNRYLYKLQITTLRRMLTKYNVLLRNKKVLDVGCGTGFFSQFYLENSAHIVGIDITSTAVEQLKKSLPQGDFFVADISAQIPPHSDLMINSFDIINVFGILYHLVEDSKFENAMVNLSNLLMYDGYLFISDYFGDKDVSAAQHVKFRGSDKYRILEQAGIIFLEIVPVYHFMNRRLGNISLESNNAIAPFLYFIDSMINHFGLLKGKDIRLLVAKKVSG